MIQAYALNDDILDSLDLSEFNCGDKGLDNFLTELSCSLIQHNKKYNNTIIFVEGETNQVVAYTTTRFNSLNIEQEDRNIFLSLSEENCEIPDIIPALEVLYLAVTDNQQERGYGTEIINSIIMIALEYSISIGCRYLFLWSIRTQEIIDFYKKFGFKEMLESSKGENLMLMRLDLLSLEECLDNIE